MGDKFKKAHEVHTAKYKESNDRIVALYMEIKDHIEVARRLELHPSNVLRLLKKRGLESLPKRGERLTLVKQNPFIGDEESDYWIGILATDGSIDFNRRRVALGMIDKEHIKKFVSFTKADIGINVYTSLKFPDSILYRTQFTDKATVGYLESIGFCKNKTFDISLNIPINRHILRGIFEGDGSITYINNKRGAMITMVSASIAFAKQIKRFLVDSKINGTASIRMRKAPLYTLTIVRRTDVLKFIDLIYKDATIFLDRKYVKCLDIVKTISENSSNSVNQR